MKGVENKPVRKAKDPKFVRNPRIKEAILENLRNGGYIEQSVLAAGVNKNTYYSWKRRADKGISPYKELFEEIDQARAEFENNAITEIRDAGHKNWAALAWILERTRQEQYGKFERVKVSNDTKIDIELHGVERAEAQELIKNGNTIEVIPNETKVEPE